MKLTPGKAVIGGLILIVIILGALIVIVMSTGRSKNNRPFSSFGVTSEGYKALYLLLEENNFDTARLDVPFTQLEEFMNVSFNGSHGDRATLVVAEPLIRPVQKQEGEMLRRWVEKGNRLVMLATWQTNLPDILGLEVEFDDAMNDQEEEDNTPTEIKKMFPFIYGERSEIQVNDVHYLMENVESIYLYRNIFFVTDDDADSKSDGHPFLPVLPFKREQDKAVEDSIGYTVLAGEDDKAFVMYMKLGAGDVVALADPHVFTNESITLGDNLTFLLNALNGSKEPGPVLFDEYHHGFGVTVLLEEGTTSELGEYLMWPAVQVFIFTILLLITIGWRFASPRSLPVPAGRPVSEMIGSSATIYSRAGARRLALATLYLGLRRRILRRFRLPLSSQTSELISLLQQVTGEKESELWLFFNRMDYLSSHVREQVSANEMIRLSRQIDRYRKELSL